MVNADIKLSYLKMKQLAGRLNSMKNGDEKKYLQTNFEIFNEMSESEREGVINLYLSLLKIYGMSEVMAWAATIQIARRMAREF